MNFIFAWWKQYFAHSLRSLVKYLFLPLEDKIHIFHRRVLHIYPLFLTVDCKKPLGLEDGGIKDSQLSADSYKSYMWISRLSGTYNMKAKDGRLNNTLAWCGLSPYRDIRPDSYFQVSMLILDRTRVTHIIEGRIQGGGRGGHFYLG